MAFEVASKHISAAPYPVSLNGTRGINDLGSTIRSSGSGGGNCSDSGGQFPCTCLAYQKSVFPSIETVPPFSFTLPQGGNTTYSGYSITHSVYSGSLPPPECGNGCRIKSSRVRILFWPVDDQKPVIHNTSDGAAIVPYTTVSDDFTL